MAAKKMTGKTLENKPEEALESQPEKRIITGPAGFALMRLARKSGVYSFYRELIREARKDPEMDRNTIGIEMMLGVSERLTDCETEFWDTASLIYGQSVDELMAMDFESVLSTVALELIEPGMMSFFTKTQAESGK